MTTLQQEFLCDVWDRPAGSTTAPIRLGYLPATAEVTFRRGLDKNEWATVRLPVTGTTVPSWLRQMHVLRVTVLGTVTSSGAFHEFRINRIVRRAGWMTIECRGLMDDFTAAGLVYDATANDRLVEFTATKTVTQWVDFLVAWLAARGHTYVQRGTVTPTDTVTLTVTRQTAQQILQTLTSGAAQIGVWEYYMDFDAPNGVYKLHVVQQYNSSATPLRVIGGQNIQDLEDASRSDDFIAGVTPSGAQGNTLAGRSIGQTYWKVSSVTASPAKVVVADPGGNANVKCIKFDDQFNAIGVTVVAQCVRTGRRHTITDSVALTQELYLNDVALLQSGDLLELFYVPAGTTLTRHYARVLNSNVRAGVLGCALKVSVVNAGSNVQVQDPRGVVGTPIYGRNSGLTGAKVLRSTLVLSTAATNFNNATNVLTVASTAGVVAGDWGFLMNVTPQMAYDTFQVKTVLSGTTLEIQQRYGCFTGVAWTIPNGALASLTATILHPQADAYYCTKHTGYQNNGADPQQAIYLDNTTNFAVGNYLELYVETGGVPITELWSPTALAGYPNVTSNFEYRARDIELANFGGEPQMLAASDPWLESDTDSLTGNVWVTAAVATVAGTTHGTKAMVCSSINYQNIGQAATTDANQFIRCPRLLRDPFVGSGRVVYVARVKVTAGAAGWGVDVNLYSALSFIKLATVSINASSGHPLGSWFWLTISLDPTATNSSYTRIGGVLPFGLFAGADPSVGGALGQSIAIDAHGMYWSPDGAVKPDSLISRYGGGPAMWSKANDYLSIYHTPPRSLVCDMVDLYRIDRTVYTGKQVILGGPALVYNEPTGTDLSARITSVEMTFSTRVSARVGVDLNTAEQTLADLILGGV